MTGSEQKNPTAKTPPSRERGHTVNLGMLHAGGYGAFFKDPSSGNPDQSRGRSQSAGQTSAAAKTAERVSTKLNDSNRPLDPFKGWHR